MLAMVISVSLLLILVLGLGEFFSSGGLIVWGALIIPLMAMVTLQSERYRSWLRCEVTVARSRN